MNIDRILILSEGEIKLNEELSDLEANLEFRISQDLPPDVIYHEKFSMGYKSISHKNEGAESAEINLELLFSAVQMGALNSNLLDQTKEELI